MAKTLSVLFLSIVCVLLLICVVVLWVARQNMIFVGWLDWLVGYSPYLCLLVVANLSQLVLALIEFCKGHFKSGVTFAVTAFIFAGCATNTGVEFFTIMALVSVGVIISAFHYRYGWSQMLEFFRAFSTVLTAVVVFPMMIFVLGGWHIGKLYMTWNSPEAYVFVGVIIATALLLLHDFQSVNNKKNYTVLNLVGAVINVGILITCACNLFDSDGKFYLMIMSCIAFSHLCVSDLSNKDVCGNLTRGWRKSAVG